MSSTSVVGLTSHDTFALSVTRKLEVGTILSLVTFIFERYCCIAAGVIAMLEGPGFSD